MCVPCAAGTSRCPLCSRPPNLPPCTFCRLPIKGLSTIFCFSIPILSRVGLAMTCSLCSHRTHARCFHKNFPSSSSQCPACLCHCVPGPYLPITLASQGSVPGGRLTYATLSSTLGPKRDPGVVRVASGDVDGQQQRASGVISGEVLPQRGEGLLGRARLRGLAGERLLHWKG